MLLLCVFSRQVWFSVLQGLGLQELAPQPDKNSLDDWWDKENSRVESPVRKGLNSVIILVAWSLWNHRNPIRKGLNSVIILVAWSLCNHRNRCVFYGWQLNLIGVLSSIREELHLWGLAGARGVTHILAQLPAG